MRLLKQCLLLGVFLMSTQISWSQNSDAHSGADWRLAVQAWSFNKYTLFEAIDKTAALGIQHLEAYPGQSLSKEHPDVKFGPEMPEQYRADVKKKLNEAGVKLVNFGVAPLDLDEAKDRKLFEFAQAMGIETITSEPPGESIELVDKLANEYGINVAIHNHPQPSHYWNPDTVLKVCAGRSKRLGACADTGHWLRSGLDPVDCLKKLQGHIISLHFKDLNERSGKGHDVPWGTGASHATAMMDELKRQGFQGVFSIEYEYNWENSMPEMAQCVKFFNDHQPGQ